MNRLNPRATWLFFVYLLVRWLWVIVFFGIWLTMFLGQSEFGQILFSSLSNSLGWWLVIAWVVIGGSLYLWALLTCKNYGYELAEDSFRMEQGVITKKYVTIPYEKIQNVDIYRNLWARILGLSDIQIQTAGASAVVTRRGFSGVGAEGRLPALETPVAEQLRNELIKRSKQTKA